MDEYKNNINFENINESDIIFLGNKDLHDRYLGAKGLSSASNIIESNNQIISDNVIKYKKQIKVKINKLLENYTDTNNLLKTRQETSKCKEQFHLFLSSLIDNIKLSELKKEIKCDLSGYSNTNTNTSHIELSNNFNIVDIDNKLVTDNKNNITNKNNIINTNNLNKYVNILNKKKEVQILPKRRI